jgi:hypothetical protein
MTGRTQTSAVDVMILWLMGDGGVETPEGSNVGLQGVGQMRLCVKCVSNSTNKAGVACRLRAYSCTPYDTAVYTRIRVYTPELYM